MNLHDELLPILREIEILSPAAFRYKGETISVTPGYMPSVPGIPSHPLPEMPLIRDLQGVLYGRCYARRMEDAAPPANPAQSDPTFVVQLSQSNRSRTGWDGGWTIYQLGQNGNVWLVKGDRQRSAVPGEYVTNGAPGTAPQPGAIVSVTVPRESTVAQAGFYYIYSETLGDVWDDQSLVRFYFHTPSSAAADLIEQLTLRLNRYQVPFRMKALNEPAMYGRTDAAVLYVARRYYSITVRIVRDLPRTLTDQMLPSIPLFTSQLQPGIGIAEDPNTGESFGMHRCRLTAEGIVDAWQRGDLTSEGRLSAITARFEQNGCKLEFPHLGSGSVDLAEVAREVEFSHA